MLEFNGKEYLCNNNAYSSFYEALVEELYRATWYRSEVKFKGINPNLLGPDEKKMYFILLTMTALDTVAVLESANYKDYLKRGGKDFEYAKDLLNNNSLWSMRVTMPATYKGNYSMQASMFPAMEGVFQKWNRSVQCANGKYLYKQVISLLADQILFNPETSPFEEVMDIYIAISANEDMRSLCEYIRNEDLPKARILAMQIAEDDLLPNDFVSIGDMRKARYNCKTKELWGDSSYMDVMLSLPPSMWSEDYFQWLNNAGHASGKDLGLDSRCKSREVEMGNYGLDLNLPEDEPDRSVEQPAVEEESIQAEIDTQTEEETPAIQEVDVKGEIEKLLGFSIEEELVAQLPEDLETSIKEGVSTDILRNKVRLWYVEVSSPKESKQEEDYGPLKEQAELYCQLNGLEFLSTYSELKEKGYTCESLYRALPLYVKEKVKDVNAKNMRNYLYALYDAYGSTELRYDEA